MTFRVLLSFLTIPVWLPILMLSFELFHRNNNGIFLFLFSGAMVKLMLWCSGFFDWIDADHAMKTYRPTRSTYARLYDID